MLVKMHLLALKIKELTASLSHRLLKHETRYHLSAI